MIQIGLPGISCPIEDLQVTLDCWRILTLHLSNGDYYQYSPSNTDQVRLVIQSL